MHKARIYKFGNHDQISEYTKKRSRAKSIAANSNKYEKISERGASAVTINIESLGAARRGFVQARARQFKMSKRTAKSEAQANQSFSNLKTVCRALRRP